MLIPPLARRRRRPLDRRWRWRIILIRRRRLEMGGIRALLSRWWPLLSSFRARAQRSLIIITLAAAPRPFRFCDAAPRDRSFDKRSGGIGVIFLIFDGRRGRPQDASLPVGHVPSRPQCQTRSVCLHGGGLPPDGRSGLRLGFLRSWSVGLFRLLRALAPSTLGPPRSGSLRLPLFWLAEAGSR